jgi:hypothetical protein
MLGQVVVERCWVRAGSAAFNPFRLRELNRSDARRNEYRQDQGRPIREDVNGGRLCLPRFLAADDDSARQSLADRADVCVRRRA